MTISRKSIKNIAPTLFLASLLSLGAQSPKAQAQCKREIDHTGTHFEICQSNELRVEKTFFSNGIDISSIRYFQDNLLIKEEFFSINSQLTIRNIYEYLGDGTYLLNKYMGDFEKPRSVEKFIESNGAKLKLETYGFHPRTGVLESIDILNEDRVISRKIIKDNEYSFHYKFIYEEDRVVGFESFVGAEKIGDYHQNKIDKLPINPSDIRAKIAIIDSGFDHGHDAIRDSIYLNNADPIDGIDNDGDGFVDNFLGVYFNETGELSFLSGFDRFEQIMDAKKGKYFSIPFETMNTKRSGEIDSHGTHVASLALRDTQHTVLFPFAGDYGSPSYLDKISKKIRKEKIDFVNMSFSFPHYATGDVSRSTHKSLRKLIESNPETVFFVAAGNDGRFFNGGRFNCLYPACYRMDNVVTIGASNTDSWGDEKLYEMAEFSNYGAGYVDLFAPGNEVEGALLGNMKIRYSGTSMASPNAMNIAILLKEEFPHKSAREIQKALQDSATIDLNIKAKYGVIDYQRARYYLKRP